MLTRILLKDLKERGDIGGDNIKVDLKGIRHGLESSGSRSGQVLVCCEHGNDPFVYHLGSMVSIVVSTNVS